MNLHLNKKTGVLIPISLLFLFTIGHTLIVCEMANKVNVTILFLNFLVIIGYIVMMTILSCLYLNTNDFE